MINHFGGHLTGFCVEEFVTSIERQRGFFHPPQGGPYLFLWAAFHHGDTGLNGVALDFRQEHHSHKTTADQTDGEKQQRGEAGEGDVAITDKYAIPRQITALHKAVETAVAGVLHTPEPTAGALRPHLRQVGRQHQFGFQQREGKTQDHHCTDRDGEAGGKSRDQQQGHKRHNGGQHTEGHRCCHLERAGNHTVETAAILLHVRVGALADDDGVVHHDAEHHDETEQTQHVEIDTHQRHHREGTEKRYRNAPHDPERQADIEEQRENDEHQQSALHHIGGHQIETVAQCIGRVIPRFNTDALRQGGFLLCHIFLHGVRHLQQVLVAGDLHVETDGGFAVEARVTFAVFKAVADSGDVAECQQSAVGSRQ